MSDQEPLPVTIASVIEPVPVVMAQSAATTITKGDRLTLTPTTTEAQDAAAEGHRLAETKTTQGQRRINLIWETSQAAIALIITLSIAYCAINEISSQDLTNAFFLIVGFYFSRVNHQAIGGVGRKPEEAPYTGR